MIVKEAGKDVKHPPSGSYPARCVRVIDLGTEPSFRGNPPKRKVYIGWELDKLMDDGRPHLVGAFYSATLAPKADLRALLEAWRGKELTEEERKGFDLSVLLSKGCLLAITTPEAGWPEVTTALRLPQGMKVPEQVNPNISIDLNKFDVTAFNGLSDYFKQKIMASPEYQKLQVNGSLAKSSPAAGVDDGKDEEI